MNYPSPLRKRLRAVFFFSVLVTTAAGCTQSSNSPSGATSGASTPQVDRGVGPITEVKIEALNIGMAASGKELFASKCASCHKIEEKYVGPALKGVTDRRRPEWIMNMILNPAEMTLKDPIAKDLLGQYLTTMSFQNVSKDEARQLLEFFRQGDAAKK